MDVKVDGIPFCSIIIKGANTGVQSDVNGDFIFRKLRPGKYVFVVMQLNYDVVGMPVTIERGQSKILRVKLEIKSNTIRSDRYFCFCN